VDKPVIIQIIRERQHPAFASHSHGIRIAFTSSSTSTSHIRIPAASQPGNAKALYLSESHMNCTWLCVPLTDCMSVYLSGRLAPLTVCICNTSLHFLCPVFIKDAHRQSTLWFVVLLHLLSAASTRIHNPGWRIQHQVPLAAAVWHFCGGGCGGSFWFWFPFRSISRFHGPRLLIMLS